MNRKVFLALMLLTFFLVSANEIFGYVFLIEIPLYFILYWKEIKEIRKQKKLAKVEKKEQKKKEKMVKYLQTEEGQKWLDDIDKSLERVDESMKEVDEIYRQIKKGEE